MCDTIVQRRCLTAIGFGKQRHARVTREGGAYSLISLILASVVNEHDIEVGIILFEQIVERAHCIHLLIVSRHDDRYQWRVGRNSIGKNGIVRLRPRIVNTNMKSNLPMPMMRNRIKSAAK